MLIKKLPEDVGTYIAKTFSIQGVAPMTPAAYKDIVVTCIKEAMCASGGPSTSALRDGQVRPDAGVLERDIRETRGETNLREKMR